MPIFGVKLAQFGTQVRGVPKRCFSMLSDTRRQAKQGYFLYFGTRHSPRSRVPFTFPHIGCHCAEFWGTREAVHRYLTTFQMPTNANFRTLKK